MNVLITGASRGLGYELAMESLIRKHYVYALVRNEEAKQKLEQRLEADGASDKQYTIIISDVCDEEGIRQAAAMLKEQQIKLHRIINGAAVLLARQTSIEELDMNDVQTSFDINLFGPLRVIKHMLPLLDEREGMILNISSEAGSIHNAYAGDYPYTLSKGALNLLSEQLRRLLKKSDIDVWSIHPGWMRTDMGGEAAPLDPRDSAISIIDIMERKVMIDSQFSFIDYKGQPMKI